MSQDAPLPQTVLYADTATQAVFEKAKDSLFSYELKQAEDLFELCVKREAENVDYLCWLAQTKGLQMDHLHRQGKSALTLVHSSSDIFKLYDKALEINPASERARLGEALRLRLTPWILGGSDKKANEAFKQIVRDYPQSMFPLHELGVFYLKDKNDPKNALHYFESALNLTKDRPVTKAEAFWLPRTYYYIGRIYLNHLNQPQVAVPYLEKAFQSDNYHVEFGIELSKAYLKLGQKQKAEQVLTLTAELCKEYDHKIFKPDLQQLAKDLDLNKDWLKNYNLM